MQNPVEPRANAPAIMTVEIAHSLRELLTVLLASLEQLERQSLDDRGREQLKRAERAAREISESINHIQPLR
jgi:hypothetical protein